MEARSSTCRCSSAPASAARARRRAVGLTLLAQTREGYGNRPSDHAGARARPRASTGWRPRTSPIRRPAAHLRGLPECLAILTPEYGADAARVAEQARWLARVFPRRAWVGLTLLHRSREDLHRDATVAAAREAGLPLVALGQVQMHLRSRQPLHDTWPASAATSRCRAAATRWPATPSATCARACGWPACTRPRRWRRRWRWRGAAASLDELRYEYPDEIVPRVTRPPPTFARRRRPAPRRFPQGVPEAIATQIEKELGLIRDLQYEAYFLTVYDIVQYARGQGILCQGRGSAANSAVCYCLGITEVDPIRGHALFERFISKERNEPPDIDVDFEHQRREEVIQYIYDKYGRDARADRGGHLLSAACLRDTGRALGVDNGVIDAVARAHQWWDGKKEMLRTLGACGLDPDSRVARQWPGWRRR